MVQRKFEPFCTLHVGAGNHSPEKRDKYKNLCKESIQLGMDLLKDGHNSEQVVVMVGKHLEDSAIVNCGSGSQLNFKGDVECDASIMSSNDMIGTAVGAVSGVLNPLDLADRLLQHLRGPKDKRGRSKPLLLVGKGAKDFGQEQDVKIVSPYSMISKRNQETYDLWKAVVDNDEKKSQYGLEDDDGDDDEKLNDTVGIICGDENGNVVVGASSGGILLKQPGRLGPAAVPKAGIAIYNDEANMSSSLSMSAACATGHGEDILTTSLSSECVNYLARYEGDESQAYTELFGNLPKKYKYLQSNPLYLGLLAVSISNDGKTTVSYAHTSESMIIAYGSINSKPHTIHSTNHTVGNVCFGAAVL